MRHALFLLPLELLGQRQYAVKFVATKAIETQ
jgi:hypothetical protein